MADYNIRDFVRKLEALNRVFTTMPAKIGTLAVNFSKERFREKNWINATAQPWQPLSRKRKSRTGKARKSQSILVDTGRLAHSIRKIYADQNLIIIATDVPYAQLHNEGGRITKSVEVRKHARREFQRKSNGKKSTVKAHTVRAHMRKMNLNIPARKFMGESEELNRRIIQLVDNEFQNALNS
jgi:phage gpG-like protein